MRPEYRVFIYENTQNLGDAIQTVALCRLLNAQCMGVYRDRPLSTSFEELPLVVNGWLGRGSVTAGRNSILAGVHAGAQHEALARWALSLGSCGARDPYTHDLLTSLGAPSQLVGCATLSFPRYRGPRRGLYCIDAPPVPGARNLTNEITHESWEEQWRLAELRLDQIRRAELIYTTRLHVVLPCLAFGTPVVFPSRALPHIDGPERLGILKLLDFCYDEPVVMDVSSHSAHYIVRLEQMLNRPLEPTSAPDCPIPIGDASPIGLWRFGSRRFGSAFAYATDGPSDPSKQWN